ERVAAETPAVLLIDDIQWADPGSLELLHQLARSIGRLPAALVLTYRPQDRDESDRLRQLHVSLRRLGLVEEVELDRLPPQPGAGCHTKCWRRRPSSAPRFWRRRWSTSPPRACWSRRPRATISPTG